MHVLRLKGRGRSIHIDKDIQNEKIQEAIKATRKMYVFCFSLNKIIGIYEVLYRLETGTYDNATPTY